MEQKIITKLFETEHRQNKTDEIMVLENHCHSRFEMICVIEGQATITIEGQRLVLSADTVVIIPPLVYHTVTVETQDNYDRLTVLFDSAAIPHTLGSYYSTNDYKIITSPTYILSELKRICASQRKEFYAPLCDSLMTQLLYECRKDKEPHGDAFSHSFLQSFFDYVESHLYKQITLDDIATHMNLSKSSISHTFACKMNITPKQYIIQKKMAIADRLIREGTPPTEVSLKIGYENYSDFYRIYKKHFNKSPKH